MLRDCWGCEVKAKISISAEHRGAGVSELCVQVLLGRQGAGPRWRQGIWEFSSDIIQRACSGLRLLWSCAVYD